MTDIQIQGNDTKRYTNVNFVGIEAVGPNLIDASDMEFFHFDAWTPNMSTVRVKLVDFGADENFAGGDDSEHEIVYENAFTNAWVSYMIPMSDFVGLSAQNNLAQLIFSGLPAGEGALYIDNVYFSKDPVAVTEEEAASFKMFPNPAATELTIQADFDLEQVVIYDVFGKVVLRSQQLSNISIELLPKGNYVVIATGNEVSISRKLVKK